MKGRAYRERESQKTASSLWHRSHEGMAVFGTVFGGQVLELAKGRSPVLPDCVTQGCWRFRKSLTQDTGHRMNEILKLALITKGIGQVEP